MSDGTLAGEPGASPLTEEIRSYWDTDSATYDQSSGHKPRTYLELAAWAAALSRLLPPVPARVLDAGAGTGFVSVLIARLGYEVTALDLSPGMLARLRENADDAGVRIATLDGDAASPPEGAFDAVVERHLLWTLRDPAGALAAWHRAAPDGRLLLLESVWGAGSGPAERLRASSRRLVHRLRRVPPDHHAEYGDELRAHLPLAGGASPERLVSLVESSPWAPARFERLRDVEYATRLALPSAADRAVGVAPRFAVIGGS